MTTKERLEKVERELGESRAELANLRAELAERIKSRAVEIVDESGQTRARLAVDQEGTRLALFDDNGKERAALAAPKTLSMLEAIFGKEGATLRMGTHNPGLYLLDEGGKALVSLQGGTGSSHLSLGTGKKVKNSVWLAVDTGAARLELHEERGKAEVAVTVNGPRLRLQDETRKVVWHAPK